MDNLILKFEKSNIKRYLCPAHAHHLAPGGKPVLLSTEHCSICRWEKRPLRLKDMARQLEYIADSMRMAAEHPNYDPHGFTYREIFPLMNKFLKSCHKDYRQGFIDQMTKGVDL